MHKKILSLRSASIVGAALAAGCASGNVAERFTEHFHMSQPGIAQLITGVSTLWIINKLDSIIKDDSDKKE